MHTNVEFTPICTLLRQHILHTDTPAYTAYTRVHRHLCTYRCILQLTSIRAHIERKHRDAVTNLVCTHPYINRAPVHTQIYTGVCQKKKSVVGVFDMASSFLSLACFQLRHHRRHRHSRRRRRRISQSPKSLPLPHSSCSPFVAPQHLFFFF